MTHSIRIASLSLPVLLTLAACSSPAPKVADLAGPLTDGSEAVDASVAVDADVAYYTPSGTTLTPFLSTQAGHTFSAPEMVLTSGKDYLAVLETDAGRMVFDLLEADTPITVNSFVFLARHHYFDGQAFHRVISGFVAQGGDPNTLDADTSSWGSGGPGYGYGLEIVTTLKYDSAGFVGMARTSDPNSNGSQFFITLAATHNLDGQYTIFAKVTEGLEVLPKIVRGEPPAVPTRMTRVYIVER